MGIFDYFRRAPGNQYVTIRSVNVSDVMGLTVSQLYEQQPALQAVTSFLADNVAQLPIKSYIRVSDNDRQRDTTSRAALLIQHPNHHDTIYEIIRDTVLDYLLYGESLWYFVADPTAPAGYIVERIPRAWVSQVLTRDGFTAESFKVQNPNIGSGYVTINAADVIHFKQYSPDGSISAPSPVDALKQVLAEQVAAWRYRNGVWKNGGQVSSYITRPLGAEWTPDQREKFATSWKEKFSGRGTDTGGTPLLEDGMKIERFSMNAREAEWSEATKLARGDVAAVYHVNPALIWHDTSLTYASAKDNARALYSDTLAPIVDMLQTRINAFLVPRLHVDDRTYLEFDFSAKTAASFEEQAGAFYSATGGAFLTVNEARAKLNLPALETGDDLRLPLNTTILDGSDEEEKAAPVETKAAPSCKAEPELLAVQEIGAVIRKFAKRQERRVCSEMAKPSKAASNGDWPEWWDAERWDRELASDLAPVFKAAAARKARQTMKDLGVSGYDASKTEEYFAAMAAGKARAINNVTARQLMNLDEAHTPASVFEQLKEKRADVSARSFATAVAVFAAAETVRQCAPARAKKATKTWVVTSDNPRSSHADMNGETVLLSESFSNGMYGPGDKDAGPDETCNCQCQMIISLP